MGTGTASVLLRPSTPAEAPNGHPAPPDDPALTDQAETEGRGETGGPESQAAPARPRRKRTAPTGKTKSRNLHLTDDVHDRLGLLARERKTTVSAVANDLLDKVLPRWEVKRIVR